MPSIQLFKRQLHLGLLALALSQSAIVSAQAMPTVDYGKAEFEANCSGCHGLDGAGNGHFRDFLVKPPADLTTLSQRNDKVFPFQRVYQVIDGRSSIGAHGDREMPIWGADYRTQAMSMSGSRASPQPEANVRHRINLLVEYISRIQRP